ncbi:DUF4190 domain-containing protein [Flavobacterium sp. TP390]|uniref:DUF4190 domain-containing protein n=1 Tax=Flavobacterium profundi TaxID=1774945 RepID=A0A6I4IVV4_9FLAO|nr:CCC motif membrane protein [Flavobacterium profundi]MVO10658.1 DUF4190 domain-containing protein [Flavobacterium profundi]
MEKKKLPNEQTIMILGILSYIGCCCTAGILGAVLSGIGLSLANKSEKIYNENPAEYDLGSLKTWKIVNIIALVLSAIFIIRLIYIIATGQFQEIINIYNEALEKSRGM